MINTRFVLIVERGILEEYTIFCVSTIREFGGKLANAPISCYAPRKQFYPPNQTIEALEKLGAEVILQNFNEEYSFYSLINKPIVLREAARKRPSENIIFLDSDTIMLGEPSLLIDPSHDLAIAPVFEKGIGIGSKSDRNYPFWQKLCQLTQLDIDQFPRVKVGGSGEEIFAYWNTGVIGMAAPKHIEIIAFWYELITKAIDERLFPNSSIYFLEQATFAVSIVKHKSNILTIEREYNFQISNKMLLDGESSYLEGQEIKIIHHLNEIDVLSQYISEALKINDQKKHWVLQQIKELKINHPLTHLKNKVLLYRRNWLERSKYFYIKRVKNRKFNCVE